MFRVHKNSFENMLHHKRSLSKFQKISDFYYCTSAIKLMQLNNNTTNAK